MRKQLTLLILAALAVSACGGGPPPADIVVDNSDPGFAAEGKWGVDSAYPHLGSDYLYALVPAKTGGPISATWNAEIPKTGDYEVFIRWPADTPNDRATNALYQLQHADGIYRFQVNQANVSKADSWVSIGTHKFRKNGEAAVVLSNEGANHIVAADAVMWVYAEDE